MITRSSVLSASRSIEGELDQRPGLLQVVLSLRPGGTERLVIEITKRLNRHYRSVVCCLDEKGMWADELTSRGVPVIALGRQPGFSPSLSYRIRAIALRHRIRVLHCHHYSPFVYSLIGTFTRPRLRLVFTEHGRLSDGPPSLKRRIVNPVLGRLPGRFYAVSEALRQHMLAEGFPAHRVAVVYNGIDTGPAPGAAERWEARRALGIPEDALAIGTVGRLDPVKDFATLIEAFARFRVEHHRAILVMFGDGPERVALEELIDRRGCASSVRLLGHRSDVRALLPALDLYVNSSTSEGVSLTILEAMAAALPVIATRVGGTPEVVAHEETGLLVPSRTPEALAASMIQLVRDPARSRRLGIAGRIRVACQFDLDRMVEDYSRAYDAVGAG